MSSRHFTAAPNDTIRLRVNFFLRGVLTDPFSFPEGVKIFSVPSGGTPSLELSPVKETTGVYYVDFKLPAGDAIKAVYDEWAWIGVDGGPKATQRYGSEIEESLSTSQSPIESPEVPVAHIFSVSRGQTDPPKSGFTVKAVPRSVREAVAQYSHDRLKTITKSALEHYIRSFLDTDGPNREMIASVAKGTLQYITDKSLQATDDVMIRATQLARLFNEIRERTPAILIMDAGMESIPTGLMSGLSNATLMRGMWQGYFTKQFRIPITVSVLTNDQDSTDQLMELLELQFNNLRQMAGGSLICSPEPGHNWAVTLPLTQSISATQGVNITEDNKDQLWFANIDLNVDAEDTFIVELPFDTSLDTADYDRDYSQGSSPQMGATPGLNVIPEIIAPDTMQLNTPVKIILKRIRHTHKIVIDQPMIATIDVGSRVVTPRRLGTFNIQVLDLANRQDESGPRALVPVVAAQKLVTVTL